MQAVVTRPSLLALSGFWFKVGGLSWGGFYAWLPRIKEDLDARGWVPAEEFDPIMAAAALVPGPTFVSLAGLVGYRALGLAGSLVSMLALMLPPTMLVAGALIFLSPAILSGPLGPLTRMVTLGMAGVVIGNAWNMMRSAAFRPVGLLLLLATGAGILLGLPVVWVVIAALVAGRLVMGGAEA